MAPRRQRGLRIVMACALVGATVVGILSACGGPQAPTAPPATRDPEPFLAHHDLTDFAGQIRRGLLATPGSCVGIARIDGSSVVLLWPLGWELDPDRRGVLDASGNLAAAYGVVVEVGGTHFEGQAPLAAALEASGVSTPCPGRDYFFVADVITEP